MFRIDETGPEVRENDARFRILLPGIEESRGFSVKVYLIDKKDQFNVNIRPKIFSLTIDSLNPGSDDKWGEISKNNWCSETIPLDPGTYLYRFEITGPERGTGTSVRSLYFGDPFARETDAGIFSVLRIPPEARPAWDDSAFKVPPLEELILYELNVAEFGETFEGVSDRIPYLLSLGVNAIELMPINSVAEPTQWGYMPIFYLAPEERFGGPAGLWHLVQECHQNGMAVVLDMVYAHTDRMLPYQIGYERFFDLWRDDHYSDAEGTHRAPNPMVSAYDHFGKKSDWRMLSTRQFFAAVNAFWLREYHIDGFRYDHVNGFLDKRPDEKNGGVNWDHFRPTFASLQELSKATYQESKAYPRFMPSLHEPSRIIQIAEDLCESAYQLSAISASAINGCWEKRLADIAQDMAAKDSLSSNLGKELLLADRRFSDQGYSSWKIVGDDAIPALVVQYIESHDEPRLFYLMQRKIVCGDRGREGWDDAGFDYRNGLDGQPWWKLQPYAIALMTSVGIPMLWAGQEFAENTGRAMSGQARVRGFRPLHWDYFYNVATTPEGATVLPLVTLYRKLGNLRRAHPGLRAHRENAREELSNPEERVLVYRRWESDDILIIALNFSDQDKQVPIPFGHVGRWVDILQSSYENPLYPCSEVVTDPDTRKSITIPGNFGRIFLLESGV